MVVNLRKLTKYAVSDYLQKSRPDWTVAGHASQVVLTVSQIYWCKELTLILSGDHDRVAALEVFLTENYRRLNELGNLFFEFQNVYLIFLSIYRNSPKVLFSPNFRIIFNW
jgi:hypothetical protein